MRGVRERSFRVATERLLDSTYLLSVRALSKRYRAGLEGCTASVRALEGIALELTRGEVVALVGPPRSGKTTLLYCIAGLLEPDAGSIHLVPQSDGRDAAVIYLGDPLALTRLRARGARWALALIDNVDRVQGDVAVAFALLAAVRRAHEDGCGLLLAARDEGSVARVVDRIVPLTDGRIAATPAGRVSLGARVAESMLR